jgi:hypothetical protein
MSNIFELEDSILDAGKFHRKLTLVLNMRSKKRQM